MRDRISRFVYLAAAWLFCIGILTQVFLVGLSLLGGRPSWNDHIDLGHTLGILVLLMLIFAYVGRFSRSMKLLTWLNFGVYLLLADIVIFMTDSAPYVAALHPVLAVILFSVAGTLAIRIWLMVRAPPAQMVVTQRESSSSSAAR